MAIPAPMRIRLTTPQTHHACSTTAHRMVESAGGNTEGAAEGGVRKAGARVPTAAGTGAIVRLGEGEGSTGVCAGLPAGGWDSGEGERVGMGDPVPVGVEVPGRGVPVAMVEALAAGVSRVGLLVSVAERVYVGVGLGVPVTTGAGSVGSDGGSVGSSVGSSGSSVGSKGSSVGSSG
jgi:hypothetical protein